MKSFLELVEEVSSNKPINENIAKPKAIFVTGGPGSGKDIIVRECIAVTSATELNFIQAMDYLNDKHTLSEKTNDHRRESIRKRQDLIINGPADDNKRISQIKEELEDLGYTTELIFVSTTNEASQKRNASLKRMMVESVRQTKWEKSHENINLFSELFEEFNVIDNTKDLSNPFTKVYESKKNSKSIQKSNLKSKGLTKILKDNNSPFMQNQMHKGKIDDVRDGDVKQNKDFIYRQYSESVPTLTKSPEPKVSRFSLDKDLINKKKRGDTSLSSPKASQGDGVGPTTNIRRGGGADSAGAGLGNQTYSESRGGTQEFSNDDVANFSAQTKGPTPNPLGEKKTLKKFKESIFDFGSGDSGVGGTLGGASNKEPTVMPIDKYGQSGITIKKKKSGAK
jgi:hypothetical protein